MSQCPPPLGPTCWEGRSSICRASSPMVSVLLRQKAHTDKKEASKGEQTPLALGNMLGSMAPRVRAGMEERIAECGQRQQGVAVGAGEQYGFGAAPLLTVASHQPRQQEGQTGARGRRQSRTLVSVILPPQVVPGICVCGGILLPS